MERQESLRKDTLKYVGLAKKFVWVFQHHLTEKPKQIFGQPNSHSISFPSDGIWSNCLVSDRRVKWDTIYILQSSQHKNVWLKSQHYRVLEFDILKKKDVLKMLLFRRFWLMFTVVSLHSTKAFICSPQNTCCSFRLTILKSPGWGFDASWEWRNKMKQPLGNTFPLMWDW